MKELLILQYLNKHFPGVYSEIDGDVIYFICPLDKDFIMRFPFYIEDVESSNPYDIVNTIWQYLLENWTIQ